jgi:hypothetical protein
MQGAVPGGADHTIDQSARGFYFIAATQAVVALFGTHALLVDAALIASLAYWLERSRRALPAAALLGFAAINALITATNLLHITNVGGRRSGSLVVAVLLLWLGSRALKAARALAIMGADERVATDAG